MTTSRGARTRALPTGTYALVYGPGAVAHWRDTRKIGRAPLVTHYSKEHAPYTPVLFSLGDRETLLALQKLAFGY